MQLDSFPSDPSPSATARDNTSASLEPESASHAPDIACELSSLQSSLQTSLQPFLDNFFVHSSATTTNTGSNNCSTVVKNEAHNTSTSRTSISCSNYTADAEPTSSTETETAAAPFMPALLNHSEPLDLPKALSLPLSLSLPLPEHHLVQVFPSCSSGTSSSSPPFLLTPPLTPELPTASCRGSKSRESESGAAHKRDKKPNRKQTGTSTNQAPGTLVSEPSCLRPTSRGAGQDYHGLDKDSSKIQREAEEEPSGLQPYTGGCRAKSKQEAMRHLEQETQPQQQTQHLLLQHLQYPHHNSNASSTTNTAGRSNTSFSTSAFSFSALPEGLPINNSHVCEHDVRCNGPSSSSAHAPLSPSSPGQGPLGEAQRSRKKSHGLSGAARDRHSMAEDEDEDDDETRSGDYFSMGAKKRSASAGMATYNIVKKRRKSRTENSMAHALQFLERRSEQQQQQQQQSARAKDIRELNRWRIQDQGLDFDPSRLVRTWSLPHELVSLDFKTNLKSSRHRPPRSRMMRPNEDDEIGSGICQLRHPFTEVCQCRKRIFAVAIELSRPLSTCSTRAVDHYPGWVESIKKRKIHQNPTKWTSTLSPSPYVKLLTIRSFWDVMGARLGPISIYEKARETIMSSSGHYTHDTNKSISMGREATYTSSASFTSTTAVTMVELIVRKSKTVQFRCPAQFLKGLWEEELRNQRIQQMIPDTVRRPPRSKVFNSKPISATANANAKPALPSLFTTATATSSSSATGSSTTSSSLAPGTSSIGGSSSTGTTTAATTTNTESAEVRGQTSSPSQTPVLTEMELSLKKKHRAAAIIRSHAITEGSDMAEYKPWKDGTVTPHEGSLQSLKEMRCNIMDPWPAEESKSKDECTRILHRMREQLNIVINLQIHLRSMIKTAPTQWSFLLSIRHPGQVSIKLLLALYGPQFLQTNNFRAIEQLLWGVTKGRAAPDAEAATPVHPDHPSPLTMSPT